MSHKESESQAADGKAHFPFIGFKGHMEYVEVDGPDAVPGRRISPATGMSA